MNELVQKWLVNARQHEAAANEIGDDDDQERALHFAVAETIRQCAGDLSGPRSEPERAPAEPRELDAVKRGDGVIKNGRYFNTGKTYNVDGTLRFDFDAANARDPWFSGDTFHGYDEEGCPIWNRTR